MWITEIKLQIRAFSSKFFARRKENFGLFKRFPFFNETVKINNKLISDLSS